jgi:hypothetical protein
MATHNGQRKYALQGLKTKVGNINLRLIHEMKSKTAPPPYEQWEALVGIDWYGNDYVVYDCVNEIMSMDTRHYPQDTLIEWLGGLDGEYSDVTPEHAERLSALSDKDAYQALYIFVVLAMVDLYR